MSFGCASECDTWSKRGNSRNRHVTTLFKGLTNLSFIRWSQHSRKFLCSNSVSIDLNERRGQVSRSSFQPENGRPKRWFPPTLVKAHTVRLRIKLHPCHSQDSEYFFCWVSQSFLSCSSLGKRMAIQKTNMAPFDNNYILPISMGKPFPIGNAC